jgi:hypothetical protein
MANELILTGANLKPRKAPDLVSGRTSGQAFALGRPFGLPLST